MRMAIGDDARSSVQQCPLSIYILLVVCSIVMATRVKAPLPTERQTLRAVRVCG